MECGFCLMIYSMPTFPLFCFASLFLFASFPISLAPIPCYTIVCTSTGYSTWSVVISPWIAKKAKFLVIPENSSIGNKFRGKEFESVSVTTVKDLGGLSS